MPGVSVPGEATGIPDLPWKPEAFMARIGGRSNWLAVPAGLLCAAGWSAASLSGEAGVQRGHDRREELRPGVTPDLG